MTLTPDQPAAAAKPVMLTTAAAAATKRMYRIGERRGCGRCNPWSASGPAMAASNRCDVGLGLGALGVLEEVFAGAPLEAAHRALAGVQLEALLLGLGQLAADLALEQVFGVQVHAAHPSTSARSRPSREDGVVRDASADGLLREAKAAPDGVERGARGVGDLLEGPAEHDAQDQDLSLLFGKGVEQGADGFAPAGGLDLLGRRLEPVDVDATVFGARAGPRAASDGAGRAYGDAGRELGRVALAAEARQRLHEPDERELRGVVHLGVMRAHHGANDPRDPGRHDLEQTTRGSDVTPRRGAGQVDGRAARRRRDRLRCRLFDRYRAGGDVFSHARIVAHALGKGSKRPARARRALLDGGKVHDVPLTAP